MLEELVADEREIPFPLPWIPVAKMFVSSLESDPRSCCTTAAVFCLPLFPPNRFGLFSGCSFQHLESSCPSFLQCEYVGFSPSFFTVAVFLPFPLPLVYSLDLDGFLSDLSLNVPLPIHH